MIYFHKLLISQGKIGIIQDTFETSITWDKGYDFIETLKEKASKAIKEISGKESTVTCRLTHTYPDGLAPYFSYSSLVM